MDILLGLLLIVFGLVVTFAGIQFFFAMLPIVGFLFGFYLGAEGVHYFLNDGFLGTVTGWIVGILIGVVFAYLAWYWWYAGVLLSAGTLGSLLGSGLAELIGINSGVVRFTFALVGFIALISIAYVIDMPIYLVMFNTAMAGASVTIAGILLLFDRLDHQDLADGTSAAMINLAWWWSLVWLVLASLGIGRQLSMINSIDVPSNRWERGQLGTSRG